MDETTARVIPSSASVQPVSPPLGNNVVLPTLAQVSTAPAHGSWPVQQPPPDATLAPQPPYAPPPYPSVDRSVHQSVNVNVGGPTIVMVHKNSGPNILVRAVWFWFFGWWMGALAMIGATAASLTIIGAPLAFWIYNRIPTISTLRPRTEAMNVRTVNGVIYAETSHQTQLPLWQRFLYFVFIGSWLSLLWYSLAIVVGALIITLPISVMMLDRIGGIATLHKH